MEMNKFEEEINADCRKIFTAVSGGRFRLEELSC
jgi:hypothetical protein